MQETNGIVTVPGINISHIVDVVIGFISNHNADIFNILKTLFGVIVGLCIPAIFVLFISIIISVEGIKNIRKKEEDIYYPKKDEDKVVPETNVDEAIAKRWDTVKRHISSENQNDWRQAIMEADIILDDLLKKLGYKGDSIGDRLKRVSKGDFKTLQQAWDAHLVRNEIAHEGSSIELNHIEAKRVIGLYRQVFEEFYHIQE